MARTRNSRARLLCFMRPAKVCVPEAERAVADYGNNQPQVLAEWFGMESLVTELFQKTKDYPRMATHAQQMAKIARLVVPNQGINTFRRDDMLFKAASFLAEAYVNLNKKADAIAIVQDLRKLAVVAAVWKSLAACQHSAHWAWTVRLILRGVFSELPKDETSKLPEIVATQWIDQAPVKLSELRGQVVLLDFWAPGVVHAVTRFPDCNSGMKPIRIKDWSFSG